MKILATLLVLLVLSACSTHYIYLEDSIYHDPTPLKNSFGGQVSMGYGEQAEIPIASPSALSQYEINTCPDSKKSDNVCNLGALTPYRLDARQKIYEGLQIYRHPDTFGIQYQVLGKADSTHYLSARYGWGGINQSTTDVVNGTGSQTENANSRVSLNEYSLSYGYRLSENHTLIAQANFVEIYTRYNIQTYQSGALISSADYNDKGFHSRFGPAYKFTSSWFFIWAELNFGQTKMSYLKTYDDPSGSFAVGFIW